MSSYPNFYNNIHRNFTFQGFAPNLVPPPPPPPAYFIPPTPVLTSEKSDNEYIKSIEKKILLIENKIPRNKVSIAQVREQLRNILLKLNDMKTMEIMLKEQISTLSEDEWRSHLNNIKENKICIHNALSNINGSHLDALRKLLAKRSAKRLRMKRVRVENKKEKEEKIRKSKERSRKIDENLQKIKDEINKVEQEEEAKIQADIILKETLRKKHDAKKCIVKLDALVKLRKARQNTARGRGENVLESDTLAFNNSIDKLKSLWTQKLAIYEKEEMELRAKLNQNTEASDCVNDTEKQVRDNLEQWREHLFGGGLPQVDFGGDIGRFIAVRSQWDHYVSAEGSPLPAGWVVPTK